MKAQGFTLVELLAVIVILAVLALIATPVVLSIIDDTKESAMLRSAEMYLSGVENAVMRENMNSGGNFRPSQCTITSEGNIYCDENEKIIEVEVDGEKPKNGSIVFENGKIKEITLNYASGTIVKNEEGNLVYSDGLSEEKKLAPGLYDTEGNMNKSWEQLLADYDIMSETSDSVMIWGIGGVKTWVVGGNNCDGYYFVTGINGVLVLDDSVDYIPVGAFGCMSCRRGSLGITKIVLPKNIEIASEAFCYCSSLTEIDYSGTKSEFNSITLGNDWNIGCPEITVHCIDGDIIIPAAM